LVGGLVAESAASHRRFLEERDLMAPELAADPAWNGVTIRERSDGGIWLSGQVATAADRDRLHMTVARVLGESRAKACLAGIEFPQ
jgi:hypothetical protein